VLGHVRGQHHVDHHLTHGHPLLSRQAGQDVTVRVLSKSKMSSLIHFVAGKVDERIEPAKAYGKSHSRNLT
jgi:hypothetical protein